jgi:hypothetical protein
MDGTLSCGVVTLKLIDTEVGAGDTGRGTVRGEGIGTYSKKINTSYHISIQTKNAIENYPHIALTPPFSSTARTAPSKCHWQLLR